MYYLLYINLGISYFLLHVFIDLYFQIGGATGHIGDPSGRSTDRVAIHKDVIQDNINCIKKNLGTVFENHQKYIWSDKSDLKPAK